MKESPKNILPTSFHSADSTRKRRRLYKLGKTCSRCGSPIFDKNKSGFCFTCFVKYGRLGENNPFYGKRHTKETVEKIKAVCKQTTAELWQNPEYREKVIANATGLHRSEEFKRGQSIRTKASYDKIDGLREQRGKLFSQCWKDGRNHIRTQKNRKSLEEMEIFRFLTSLGKYEISDDEVCIGGNKYLSPDIVINNKVIVEFYGDYFHANPLSHNADEFILKKGMTAQQLWEEDLKRQRLLEGAGYSVIIVWQYNYRQNKSETLHNLVKEIDSKLKGEK